MAIFTCLSLVSTERFFSGEEPFLSMINRSNESIIDLKELGFSFAIENLKPEYGRVEAFHVKWGNNK